jgi:hypothetical protein
MPIPPCTMGNSVRPAIRNAPKPLSRSQSLDSEAK